MFRRIALFFAYLLIFCSCSKAKENNKNMIVIAHRGGSMLGNENTLSCITEGIASGADMIEIDVHQTLDNKIVVCHDPTIDRTTNGTGCIEKMTLEQIKSFLIIDKNGKVTNERIPTLEEVLEHINGRCKILLEIKRKKTQYEGIEANVLKILQKHNALEYTIIQSFNDIVLANTHCLNPSIRLEKLIIFKFGNLIFDGTFTTFSWKKYEYIKSFNFHYRFLTKGFLKKIHSHGKQSKVWTVNNIKHKPTIPVDGIITDCPNLFKKDSN